MSLASLPFQALIRGYQLGISPLLPSSCRYLPTCSDYALEAVGRHGPVMGGWLALRRILRCHPLGGSGFDPVPSVRGPARTRVRGQS
jgi:putative membrane protein insertion efficiency factor